MFLTLCAHHNQFFPHESFTFSHFFALFYRFFKNRSYNLIFRWIFYFIATILHACLPLPPFLHRNDKLTKSIQIAEEGDLPLFDNFDLFSIVISNTTMTVSKLLKWLFFSKNVPKNNNWLSAALFPFLEVKKGAKLILLEKL